MRADPAGRRGRGRDRRGAFGLERRARRHRPGHSGSDGSTWRPPDRIVAAIGPTIARASYEVDLAFRDRFCAVDPEHDAFFAAGKPGHCQFDLEGFIASRLAAAGVRTVVAMGVDTYPDEARWFSFRRTTHRSEPDYGRQLSLIALA